MELNELLESIDIVDYISQFVELEEKGGEWWGLSPFKDERTPSFSVRRETGRFYDFSSGIGGTNLTFVKHYFKCSTREAIKKLQEYAGVEGVVSHTRALECTRVAKRFQPKKSREKTGKQPILTPDYMDRYERREEKLAVWEQEGISREVLDEFQVRYDAFSDRLVYPIRDRNGNIVNVGGRTLDPDWKSKKLRKYTYFKGWEGGVNLLYGLWENREGIGRGEIILFEGAKSVMLAKTFGIDNTAALLTSHVSDAQLKILIELGCRVVFALDKDVVIRDDHNIQRLKQFVTVEYLWDGQNLLGEKDSPVDRGPETFKTLYERRLVWH